MTRCRFSIETDILHELAELDRPRIVIHRIFANCGFWPDRVQYCDLGCRGHDRDLGCRGHDTVVRDMKWITHFVSSLSFPGDDATRHSEDYGAEIKADKIVDTMKCEITRTVISALASLEAFCALEHEVDGRVRARHHPFFKLGNLIRRP